MNLKTAIIAGLVSLVLLPLQSSNGAPPPVAVDSKLYYRIGGAQSITAAPNPQAQFNTYRAATEIGIGYSCGKFDKTFGVARLINDLNRTGDALVNGAIGAVTAAIASLPMLILQRVNPGLYDLFQGILIRAEAVIQLANNSCEDYERQIAKGQNPFEDFSQLAKILDWKVQMGRDGFGLSNVDVETARENVEKNNGENGIPWVCGTYAGGKGQESIRVTYDAVLAGYNITLGRSSCDQSTPNNDPDETPLVRVWPTPDEAAQWAVEVLGEVRIRTHDDRPTEATPGFGLLRKVPDVVSLVQTELAGLVAGSQSPDLEGLRKIGAAGTLINADVIRTLRDMVAADQTLAIGKLAEEVAMAHVTEQAVMLRRLLLTGKREPNIAATPAPKIIDESVDALEKEIDAMLFEKRIHKELFAETSSAILEYGAEKETTAKPRLERENQDAPPLRDGAISGGAP